MSLRAGIVVTGTEVITGTITDPSGATLPSATVEVVNVATGYTYQGNAFHWPTIPDVLEKAGISWRIYQDPNDNWTGAMHGCLAFESFRTAQPGSAIYEKGMRHWTIEDLANDARNNQLPQVSWVLPRQIDSEHPGAPSSPYRGADFTHSVLSAITANPEVWSKTVFFLTFDENDGKTLAWVTWE